MNVVVGPDALLPPVPSVALASHIKSLDWRARQASPNGRVTAAERRSIRLKLATLIG